MDGEVTDVGVLVGGRVGCSAVMSRVDNVGDAVNREGGGGGETGEEEGSELHFVGCGGVCIEASV